MAPLVAIQITALNYITQHQLTSGATNRLRTDRHVERLDCAVLYCDDSLVQYQLRISMVDVAMSTAVYEECVHGVDDIAMSMDRPTTHLSPFFLHGWLAGYDRGLRAHPRVCLVRRWTRSIVIACASNTQSALRELFV